MHIYKYINTTWIPEMLGQFLNLNKMKTKRFSNQMSQHCIHNVACYKSRSSWDEGILTMV